MPHCGWQCFTRGGANALPVGVRVYRLACDSGCLAIKLNIVTKYPFLCQKMDVNQAKQEHLLALKGISPTLRPQTDCDVRRCGRNIKEAKKKKKNLSALPVGFYLPSGLLVAPTPNVSYKGASAFPEAHNCFTDICTLL